MKITRQQLRRIISEAAVDMDAQMELPLFSSEWWEGFHRFIESYPAAQDGVDISAWKNARSQAYKLLMQEMFRPKTSEELTQVWDARIAEILGL